MPSDTQLPSCTRRRHSVVQSSAATFQDGVVFLSFQSLCNLTHIRSLDDVVDTTSSFTFAFYNRAYTRARYRELHSLKREANGERRCPAIRTLPFSTRRIDFSLPLPFAGVSFQSKGSFASSKLKRREREEPFPRFVVFLNCIEHQPRNHTLDASNQGSRYSSPIDSIFRKD